MHQASALSTSDSAPFTDIKKEAGGIRCRDVVVVVGEGVDCCCCVALWCSGLGGDRFHHSLFIPRGATWHGIVHCRMALAEEMK